MSLVVMSVLSLICFIVGFLVGFLAMIVVEDHKE